MVSRHSRRAIPHRAVHTAWQLLQLPVCAGHLHSGLDSGVAINQSTPKRACCWRQPPSCMCARDEPWHRGFELWDHKRPNHHAHVPAMPCRRHDSRCIHRCENALCKDCTWLVFECHVPRKRQQQSTTMALQLACIPLIACAMLLGDFPAAESSLPGGAHWRCRLGYR